jgi:hypothetical protein
MITAKTAVKMPSFSGENIFAANAQNAIPSPALATDEVANDPASRYRHYEPNLDVWLIVTSGSVRM